MIKESKQDSNIESRKDISCLCTQYNKSLDSITNCHTEALAEVSNTESNSIPIYKVYYARFY